LVDNNTLGLEVLSRAQCLELLGHVPVGRIVLTVGALPAIMPVNFVLHQGEVIIRTDTGTKLAAAARNAVVAFEVDQLDDTGQQGWSVSLVGRAVEVTAAEQLAELRPLPLRPWAPGERDHYIRIKPELISGRRIAAVPADVPVPVQR
jgi:nitroimidazol reductase NimA-like FMN-containing flavoprotein (pyridoxamine 5'-phosphate oxidase superfamily)